MVELIIFLKRKKGKVFFFGKDRPSVFLELRLAADNIRQHNESRNTLASCTGGTEF
jgi:hypothetical protein